MSDNTQQAPEQNANVEPQQQAQPLDSATEKVEPLGSLDPPKADWMMTRIANSGVSTSMLMELYGQDGFDTFKSKEEYWKDSKLQDKFNKNYGIYAERKFDEFYNNSKKEYSAYKLGSFTKSQTGIELLRDDISSLRSEAGVRFENMAGSLERGLEFSAPTKDYRENFVNVRVRKIDANGKESFEVREYSPELLEELEDDRSFGGLAYSDAFRNLDPNVGVNGVYFDTIHDGQIFDDATGEMKHVRNDQIVSRWDIDTGSLLDGVLKNNKLEADGVLDYVKIIAKAPINMWANLMDTSIQLGRAAIAGGISFSNLFRGEKLDVNEVEIMKAFNTAGIKWKSKQTSQTQEALQDGFFGSLEAFLSTTAEIALQVGLARGLSVAGAGVANVMNRGLTGAALQQAEQRYAMISVRSILTAMATKDSYNEAIETGYTPAEASIITGAMGVALWQATKYASYILGDYEGKAIRSKIHSSMQKLLKGDLDKTFASIKSTLPKAVQENAKANAALKWVTKTVDGIFGAVNSMGKQLPSTQWLYAARQEGIEEMTEELYQDIVKHGASAYSVLLNNAAAVGKGRYMTIFDDGFFKDAVERYATSGIAGAMGGPMGMVGNRVNLNNITSSSSIVDIIMAGRKNELVSVLEGMRENGELGPKELSTEFNKAEGIFEPIIAGSSQENLSDMVYNTYLHDINQVDTFLKRGLLGKAKDRASKDAVLRNHLENTSMAKDFSKLMGSLLDFHSRTGISMSVYSELDNMAEKDLLERLPAEVAEASKNLESKKAELERFKAMVESKKATAAAQEEGEPKTTDKPKTNIITEDDDSKLTRLEAEVAASSTTDNGEIRTMLDIYRKIRAISNGTASEYYLMQKESVDDPILGALENRDPEYEGLGATPIFDLFNGSRNRFFEDKLERLQSVEKAKDLEAELKTKFKDFDSKLDFKKLERLVKRSEGLLSEDALKFITKLYTPKSVEQGQNFLDPTKQEFLFRTPEGELDEDKMREFTYEVLAMNPLAGGMRAEDLKGRIRSRNEHITFFKKLASNIDEAIIPFIEENPEFEASKDGPDFLSVLPLLKSDVAKTLVKNILTPDLLAVRALAKKAETDIINERFFNPEDGINPDASYLYRYAKDGKLSSLSLAEVGLSEVEDLLDNRLSNTLFTKNDSTAVDEVLAQIKVKEAISKLVAKFTGQDTIRHYARMLSIFRKNTLDILDFEYNPGEKADTTIEVHAYKDYTALSDFFTDFIYDPIYMDKLLAKDPKVRTTKEVEELTKYFANKSYATPTSGDLTTTYPDMDMEALIALLNQEFKFLAGADLIEKALMFISQPEMKVPNDILGVKGEGESSLALHGMTKLKLTEWLLNKTNEYIDQAKTAKGDLPYLKQKKAEVEHTTEIFSHLATSIDGLEENISELVPEFYLYMSTNGKTTMSTQELAAMNIKVEKAIYELYNGIEPILPGANFTEESVLKGLKQHAQDAVKKLYAAEQSAQKDADKLKVATIVGALTTDFIPFYSKFKERLMQTAEGTAEYKVVLSAQELSAKYAAGYVYSPAFRKMLVDLALESGALLKEARDYHYIESIFISGVAGSGKTSAVTELGMTLATSILKDRGISTTAVLPVANNDSQVEIISKSVGDLSEGLAGLEVSELQDLLASAVLEKDEEALKKLSKLSTILLDEVTYVQGRVATGTSTLKYISNLIQRYNTENRVGDDKLPIALVLMGDPNQSGATSINKDAGTVESNKLRGDDTFSLPYMNFSFRGRNSFLVSSVAAIQRVPDRPKAFGRNISTDMVIGKGLRYGTLEGTFYGANIIDSSDPDTNIDFLNVLNDEELVNSIIKNIDKNIADGNTDFQVLLVPESLKEFDATNPTKSKMHALLNDDKYKHAFKIVPFAKVGGSEANYIISEFPSRLFGGQVRFQNHESMKQTKDSFNTLVTRAKDYAIVVNKNENIIIPRGSRPVRAEDGTVMIPDPTVDGPTTKKVIENYLEILKDIEVDSATKAPKKAPPTPPDSGPTDLDKDTTKIITSRIDALIDGQGALLKGQNLTDFADSIVYDQPYLAFNFITALINLSAGETDTKSVEELLTEVKSAYKALEGLLTEAFQEHFIELIGVTEMLAKSTSPDADAVRKHYKKVYSAILDEISVYVQKKKDLEAELEAGKVANVYSVLSLVDLFIREPGNITDEDILLSIDDEIDEKGKARYEGIIKDLLTRSSEEIDVDVSPKNISQEKYDLMVSEIKRLFRKRALEITPKDFKGFPDVEETNSVFSEIRLWADTLTEEQLSKIIGDIDAALADPAIQEITISNKVNALLEKYSKESVLVNTRKVINDAYVEKRSTDSTSIAIDRMNMLKAKLGIDPNIIQEMDILNAINDIITEMGTVDQSDPKQLVKALLIEEIKSVWDILYRTKKNPNAAVFGNLIYNRGVNKKETLQDFIDNAEAEDGKNEMFTAELNGSKPDSPVYLERQTVAAFDPNYIYKIPKKDGFFSQEEALNLFNFDGGDRRAPDKLEIRVLRSQRRGKIEYDFQVIAIAGNIKYPIAKLFTGAGKGTAAEHRLMAEFKKLAEVRIQDALRDPEQTIHNMGGVDIIDLKLTAPLKELLKTRIGKRVESDGSAGNIRTIEDLKDKIIVSDNLFVISTPKGLVDKGDDSSMKGKPFVLYSYNKGVDINSQELIKKLKEGRTITQNLNITSTQGSLPSSIGILPVKIKAPFKELSVVYKEEPGFKLGEYVTVMSLTMQKYIAEEILEKHEGDIETIVVKGQEHKIVITAAMQREATLMLNEFHAYVGSEDSDMSIKVKDALELIKKDTLANNSLKVILKTHLRDMEQLSKNKNSSVRAFSAISYSKANKAYIFNINKFVGKDTQSTSMLKGLDAIASYTKYQVSPYIMRSDTETSNVGMISPLFVQKLGRFLITPVKDILLPQFALTSSGIAEVYSALKIPPKTQVKYTLEEQTTRDSIKTFFSEDNIGKRLSFKTEEDSDEIAAVDRMIAHQQHMLDKVEGLSDVRSQIGNKAVLSTNIENLNNYKNQLLVLGPSITNPDNFIPIVLEDETEEMVDHIRRAVNNIIIEESIPLEIKKSVLEGISGIFNYEELNADYLVNLINTKQAINANGLDIEVVKQDLQALINNCKNK